MSHSTVSSTLWKQNIFCHRVPLLQWLASEIVIPQVRTCSEDEAHLDASCTVWFSPISSFGISLLCCAVTMCQQCHLQMLFSSTQPSHPQLTGLHSFITHTPTTFVYVSCLVKIFYYYFLFFLKSEIVSFLPQRKGKLQQAQKLKGFCEAL